MKKFIRIVVGLMALAAAIGWTIIIIGGNDWRAPMAGMGDNAVTPSESGGDQFIEVMFIGALWFLPISPYLCMAAGAFNLISGKSMRAAYIYSLVMLTLVTLIMLITFMRRLEFIALANIIIGALWAYSFWPRSGTQ